MTNPFEESADAAVDLGQFNEWLEQTADREGTSTDELLGQLVSTYWILSELTELVDESPYDTLSEQAVSEESTSSKTSSDDAGSRSELVDVVESIAKMHSQPEPQPQSQAIDSSVLELIRSLNQGGNGGSGGQGMSYRDVRAMVDDVKAVEDDVNELKRDVSGRVADLETTVEDLSGTVEQNTSVIQELTAEGAQREERLDTMESRFESSYDDVRDILTHLMDTTDEQGSKLDTVVDAYDQDVRTLKRQHSARERLAELKATAARQDISRVTCEGCDKAFNVALLGEPNCPHCDRHIREFATKSGSLRRSSTIARVASTAPTDDGLELADRIERVTTQVERQVEEADLPAVPDWWEPASEK